MFRDRELSLTSPRGSQSGQSTIQFTTTSASVAEDAGSFPVTVTRTSGTGPVVFTLSVDREATTAAEGVDYSFSDGQVVLGSSSSFVTRSLGILNNDLFYEIPVLVVLRVSDPSDQNSLGIRERLTITIVDDGDGSWLPR